MIDDDDIAIDADEVNGCAFAAFLILIYGTSALISGALMAVGVVAVVA